LNQKEEYLSFLKSLQPGFFVSETNTAGETPVPNTWIKISEANTEKIQHRQQLDCELILELDMPTRNENEMLAESIKLCLQHNSFGYSLFMGGTKSVHCHIFFNRTITNQERESFIDCFFPIVKKHLDKVFWTQERHLIALEYAPHYKTGKEKELIEKTEPTINEFPILQKTVCKIINYALYHKLPEGNRNKDLMPNFMGLSPSKETINKMAETQKMPIANISGWEKTNFNCIHLKQYAKENNLPDLCENCKNIVSEAQEIILNEEKINFTEIKNQLKNTHKHLDNFEQIDKMLGLIGDNYYFLKKFLWYLLEASIQPPKTFQIGTNYFDNREHGLIISSPAKGKGVIKNFIKRARGWEKESVVETTGTPHPEQLIGKFVSVGRGKDRHKEERRGYLSADILLNDEAQNMINETKEEYAKVQRIKRQAMDCFGFNRLNKKLVGDSWSELLDYPSPTQIVDFMHPQMFWPTFFDSGTFRRYFCFDLDSETEFSEDDSVASLFAEKTDFEAIKTYYYDKFQKNQAFLPEQTFTFTDECKIIVANVVKTWLAWALRYKNNRVRRFSELTFFSLKDMFLKNIAILHFSKHQTVSTVELTHCACIDTIGFLLETLENYCRYGSMDNTSDVWAGAQDMEINALEYLWRIGATNKENSQVSISNYNDIISELFGVNERQARGIIAKLKKRHYVGTKQVGQQSSRVWIAIKPKVLYIKEGIVDFKKMWALEKALEGGNVGNDMLTVGNNTHTINIYITFFYSCVYAHYQVLEIPCHRCHPENQLIEPEQPKPPAQICSVCGVGKGIVQDGQRFLCSGCWALERGY
jgi:hypothetical protein